MKRCAAKDTGCILNKLKLFILVFFITTSLPLAFLIWHSYSGLQQEERAQLNFFALTLYDQMEEELAKLVQAEEKRAVDEYQHFLAGSFDRQDIPRQRSPLADPSYPSYILGYLQNNPDGSMQTPLVADPGEVTDDRKSLMRQLRQANQIFNTKKFAVAQPLPEQEPAPVQADQKELRQDSFAERFLKSVTPQKERVYMGKKSQRVEEITAEQALNVASREEKAKSVAEVGPQRILPQSPMATSEPPAALADRENAAGSMAFPSAERNRRSPTAPSSPAAVLTDKFQVEVAPFQSVALEDDRVYMFRRIVIDNQIYRQGFILLITPLLEYLIDTHFNNQPLAQFTTLQLRRLDQADSTDLVTAGIAPAGADFVNQHVFAAPFDFLSVRLSAHNIPDSPARRSLNIALAALTVFMLLGLVAIYQSARTIVALSEKRSQFVSAVSHELKTPLTNIRMYIEMLEQGIARTPEREQEYLAILDSESARLTNLINNVLELSKLEKKQRHFHLVEGNLDGLFAEVETVMRPKINQEGFSLVVEKTQITSFSFDRDVLIQILVNLIENSLKFGKQSPLRTIRLSAEESADHVRLAVADTGPGIPRQALRKIFTDFYRVDNALTRSTGGTGIGLALVHKFVKALGGSVEAVNNDGPGCTISLILPKEAAAS